MNNKLIVNIACGLFALSASGIAMSAESKFTFGGDVELDLTGADDDSTSFGHGGRIKLNAVGKVTGDNYYIKGVAQPLVPFNGDSLGIDDAYLQIGRDAWDLQMGRFEAVNLFPLGKDTLISHAGGVNVYAAGDARGRQDDAFHSALHLGNTSPLKLELGTMISKQGDDKFTAVRPALTYTMGGMTLHAGIEKISSETDGVEDDKSGYGLGATAALGGGSLSASLAKGDSDISPDVTSIAVNYTKGPWGVGFVNSKEDADGGASPKVNTLYGAYTMPIFNDKNASVTFAASTSKAKNVTATNDKVNAARVRFNYTF